ncbi:unnamed protein product [Caenorhabditis bovis]|uniref:Uncharacterized protein n=1 Tax=Caenorhabditis bovis TaxID=2654633 RepID=A0A8S1EEE6_9PELO|nr:unnamed protein product [Caenorhabditis bovis]
MSSVSGGHSASPYLRRYRIPQLNTIRSHYMDDEFDDEIWAEVQLSKEELIRIRMVRFHWPHNGPEELMVPNGGATINLGDLERVSKKIANAHFIGREA